MTKTITLDDMQWERVDMALDIAILRSRGQASVGAQEAYRQTQLEIQKQRENQPVVPRRPTCNICGKEDDHLNLLILPRELYKSQEWAHPACVQALEKAKESGQEMEGQQYLWFSAQVNSMLTGDYLKTEPVVVPLFRELSPEEEKKFRDSARENHVPGDPINEVLHPIWKDEARKIDAEVTCTCGHLSRDHIPFYEEGVQTPGECNECSCGRFKSRAVREE